MRLGPRSALAASICLLAISGISWSHDIPGAVWKQRDIPSERLAIEQVLSTYTQSLSDGDEAAFASILLNDEIPFTSTAELHLSKAARAHVQTSRYSSFERAVFASGRHFKQRFYNVHIEQDGDLAQVSLDFVTQDTGSHEEAYGWKALTLLKVAGHWKIASELYTVYPLPG